MVMISVAVDRKKSLLAGHDLADRVTVEVSPEVIGAELWPALVDMLQTAYTPPRLPFNIEIDAPSADAVRTALAAYVAQQQARATEYLENLRSTLANLRTAAAAPPTPATKRLHDYYKDLDVDFGAQFEGHARVLPYIPTYIPTDRLTAEEKAEAVALVTEAETLTSQSRADIEARNALAAETALPKAREDHQRFLAERHAAGEQQAKNKAARAAARLASGYWEHETSSYNNRRYGAPWCARVTGVAARGELIYEWGDSTARHGASGLLRVPCKPGDIIAWGQKDMRNPANSDHVILRMQDDGTMETIDRTTAYKLLKG